MIIAVFLTFSLSATGDLINYNEHQFEKCSATECLDEQCCTGCGVYGINCICGVTLIFQWCETCCFQPGYGDLTSYGTGLCAGRCGGGIE